jgi:hypothetical protein
MKSSQLTNILMGLTAFSAVASIILCGLMISYSREIRQLQFQAANIQQSRIAATQLVNELAEYGKKNPQIQPILKKVTQPAAPQPAAQPAAK